ncbi:MAG: polysaccharide deacetylase family protein [Crocinitomicaceae bacterium]|nr:polysaccharide deacetylase family protein [Crocinitomicaceae bacterium]
MLLYHTPDSVAKLFPQVVFHLSREEKILYLTFDDGPHPKITPWVLDQLNQHKAKATFFCVGENLEKNLDFIPRLENEEHKIGNHSHNHLNGWKTKTPEYLKNVTRFQQVYSARLFRPPYGKINNNQLQKIDEALRVVLWDVLTGDFNKKLSVKQCFKHITKYSKAGSILVFHDSVKAEKKLKQLLPMVLSHYSNLGFKFEALPTFD